MTPRISMMALAAMLVCCAAAITIAAKPRTTPHQNAAAAQYGQPPGETPPSGGQPPASQAQNQPPRTEREPGTGAYIADNGHALVRLRKRRKVKIPGLSFKCPTGCRVVIVVGKKRIRLTVPPDKVRTATFRVPKSLRTRVQRRGFVKLKARVTLTPNGGTVLHMKKSFLLAR